MHIHMHIHTYIHTYTHTYIHIYNENLYIYIYIYIYTQTTFLPGGNLESDAHGKHCGHFHPPALHLSILSGPRLVVVFI